MSLEFDELIEKYISTLDTECIDSFRELVSKSVTEKFKKIDCRYGEHKKTVYDSPELKQLNSSWIEDDAIYMDSVSSLADELSIIALYKLFERKHKMLIQHYRNETELKKFSYWKNVLKVLPANIKQLNSFKSVNELRLINNSIKHEGTVSEELSSEFSSYGSEGSEFSELDKAFNKLKPEISKYLTELKNELKGNKT